MVDLRTGSARIRMVLEITSKATGETRTVEIVVTPEIAEQAEQIEVKDTENGSDTSDSSPGHRL